MFIFFSAYSAEKLPKVSKKNTILRFKMKKLFIFSPLLGMALSGCNMIKMVNESTRAIEYNRYAVERSTEAIYRNIEAVEKSNEAIEENRQKLQSITEAMSKME
jgi:hypothetical protein